MASSRFGARPAKGSAPKTSRARVMKKAGSSANVRTPTPRGSPRSAYSTASIRLLGPRVSQAPSLPAASVHLEMGFGLELADLDQGLPVFEQEPLLRAPVQ